VPLAGTVATAGYEGTPQNRRAALGRHPAGPAGWETGLPAAPRL